MKIFDVHAHIFPDKIADKAVKNIGDYYSIEMEHKGNVSDLLEVSKPFNVKKFLVNSTATTPEQVVSINDFVSSQVKKHPEFIGLGTLHPYYEDIDGEIERIISLGLKGVKLHPEFQNFNIDSDQAKKIYSAIEDKLILLIHMGDENKDSSSPERLLNIINEFPNLKIIAAHLGGYSRWGESKEHLIGKDIFIDTSSSLEFLSKDEATYIIKKHGTDKVLFGTDYPMWGYENEIKMINRLELNDNEKQQIFWKNAAKLFGIKD